MKKLSDYSDTSDLPPELAELAARLARGSSTGGDTAAAIDAYVDLVKTLRDEGLKSVGVSNLLIAAHRSKMNVPTQPTVRKYLNEAVKQGKLKKPSRQSYALS